MLSAIPMFCLGLLFTGNHCDPISVLDRTTKQAHADMAGVHWYQVRFDELNIGSLRESRSQLASGEYVLNRSLRFSLMRNRMTDVDERLVFSGEFPFHLQSAVQETTVTHNDTTTASRRVFPIDTTSSSHPPPMSYVATLAFHPHLIANRDRFETRAIDFADAQYKPSTWQVTKPMHNVSDYDLENADGFTTYRVSSNGVPVHTNMPGGISMTLVGGPLDQAWDDDTYLFDSKEISIRVDKAIAQHHRLVALTLRLHGNAATKRLWAPLSNADDDIHIDLRMPLAADVMGTHAATPITSVRAVTSLITENELDRSATYTNVRRLVDTLYEHITYEEIPYSSSIGETLERQTGDCTEFADVFDAVATELGWNSRIRTGLAYHPPSQSFRPHSWNEVAIDGRWISADASWGQLPADASHVPFPRENTLALLAQASSMRFEVVEQLHRSD